MIYSSKKDNLLYISAIYNFLSVAVDKKIYRIYFVSIIKPDTRKIRF